MLLSHLRCWSLSQLFILETGSRRDQLTALDRRTLNHKGVRIVAWRFLVELVISVSTICAYLFLLFVRHLFVQLLLAVGFILGLFICIYIWILFCFFQQIRFVLFRLLLPHCYWTVDKVLQLMRQRDCVDSLLLFHYCHRCCRCK